MIQMVPMCVQQEWRCFRRPRFRCLNRIRESPRFFVMSTITEHRISCPSRDHVGRLPDWPPLLAVRQRGLSAKRSVTIQVSGKALKMHAMPLNLQMQGCWKG